MTGDLGMKSVTITYTFNQNQREIVQNCKSDLVKHGWTFKSEEWLEGQKIKLTFETENKELIAKYLLNPLENVLK